MADTDSPPAANQAFAPGVAERLGFYVYLLIDPRHETVFYVGKGAGNRCFAHLVEARTTQGDSARDDPKLARIRAIEELGRAVRIVLLRHGLSEGESLLVEAAAIDLGEIMGREPLANRISGRDSTDLGWQSVADLNARYGAAPVTIDPMHRVALFRIPRQFHRGMTDEALYEATRKWWPIGPRRRQPNLPSAPQWAMAIAGGVVRAVYRIDGWERPDLEDVAVDPRRSRRWGFRGIRDREMEKSYLYRDVRGYLRGNQTTVNYVNCD